MKTFFIFLFCNLFFGLFLGQSEWTNEELKNVKTYPAFAYNQTEQDAIMYINMARLYPLKFIELELTGYFGPVEFGDYLINSKYKKSLIQELKKIKPMGALHYDKDLHGFAECFAKEQGKSGYTGHDRKRCPKGVFAECVSYGCSTGKDIAMQLLIDHNVPSLGHRKICLNPDYSKVGITSNKHKTSEYCAVLDIYK